MRLRRIRWQQKVSCNFFMIRSRLRVKSKVCKNQNVSALTGERACVSWSKINSNWEAEKKQAKNWIFTFNAKENRTCTHTEQNVFSNRLRSFVCWHFFSLHHQIASVLLRLHPHQWHFKMMIMEPVYNGSQNCVSCDVKGNKTHPMIPRAYWKLEGRHGHPPCFPTNFTWYLFMLNVDALLSLVLPFLRVGLKVFSTGKLLFDVLLSFDFVSELLPLFACCCCCCCCCWRSCCWYSISVVSQIFDQIRFASPSCSSWYQATAKSMINHHNRASAGNTELSPLLFLFYLFFFIFFIILSTFPFSVCHTQMGLTSLTLPTTDSSVSRFFTNRLKSPRTKWNIIRWRLLLVFRFYFLAFLKYSHTERDFL